MTDLRQRENRPGRGGSSDHVAGAMPQILRHRWCTREDLWRRYPEPSANFRISMFGLSLEAYVGEVRRRQADGWAGWEISIRFPRPDVTS